MSSLEEALRRLEEALADEVREQVQAALAPLRPDGPDGLLSVRDAAEWLGVGRTKVYELIAAGELEVVEGISKGGHGQPGRKVPVESLRDFVERRRSRNAPRRARSAPRRRPLRSA